MAITLQTIPYFTYSVQFYDIFPITENLFCTNKGPKNHPPKYFRGAEMNLIIANYKKSA